ERAPSLQFEVSPSETANFIQDISLKDGMLGAYDIARIARDTGWQPLSARQSFHDYMDWIVEN
ncbi:NAD(P)-dependent oxidoreductase, partial [Rhizobium brockwellii]